MRRGMDSGIFFVGIACCAWLLGAILDGAPGGRRTATAQAAPGQAGQKAPGSVGAGGLAGGGSPGPSSGAPGAAAFGEIAGQGAPALPGMSPGMGSGALRPGQLPAVPWSVEEMLEIALRSNPDILVAESKVREAQAELNQVRLKVTQQVLSVHHKKAALELSLANCEQNVKVVNAHVQVATRPQSDLDAALFDLAKARSGLPEMEAEARYVLGLGGGAPPLEVGQASPTAQPGMHRADRPPIPEQFAQVLGLPVMVSFQGEITLQEALGEIQTSVSDQTAFVIDQNSGLGEQVLGLKLPREVPLRAALQAIADVLPDVAFVFREYGLLVTDRSRAMGLRGAAIPDDLPLETEE